ncbi:MAG: hypothetical protein E7433_00305 [Ruminococcaceae bacterium]|nr:hypothetical protein [Oscillospiraceae bacterium]
MTSTLKKLSIVYIVLAVITGIIGLLVYEKVKYILNLRFIAVCIVAAIPVLSVLTAIALRKIHEELEAEKVSTAQMIAELKKKLEEQP